MSFKSKSGMVSTKTAIYCATYNFRLGSSLANRHCDGICIYEVVTHTDVLEEQYVARIFRKQTHT